ncbi:hypothetical protein SDC9_76636 [bioreactor metagenome]|uniref:Uncharacterized protein n=1 Tax=bioreactor metagenome TaxID=1076179 RepID=A0A644YUE0_9ZZZZ
MNELVGQCQITNGIQVLSVVVIIIIPGEALFQAVTVVQHGGYTIETETVESIFLHPVFAVRKQKMEDFIFAVIKAK